MPILVIFLGMVIPTCITWIYFDLLANAPEIAQKIAYAAGKLSQVGIMLVAYWLWRKRGKHSPNEPSLMGKPICMRWIALGCISGLAIGCLSIVVFQWVLMPLGVMDSAKLAAKEKLQSMGVDSPAILFGIAIWAVIYHRCGNLIPGWISHALVDAAIFIIGFRLVFA